jgi:hypothetical protein
MRQQRAHSAFVDDALLGGGVARREVDQRLGHGEQQNVVVGAQQLDQRQEHVRGHELLALELDLRRRPWGVCTHIERARHARTHV